MEGQVLIRYCSLGWSGVGRQAVSMSCQGFENLDGSQGVLMQGMICSVYIVLLTKGTR